MLGMLCWKTRGRTEVTPIQVADMRVLCAWVRRGGRWEGRRIAHAARRLHRAGVRRMLESSKDGPCVPGFPQVHGRMLYRAVADRVVMAYLMRYGIPPERASVVLKGERPDADLVAAARFLCPRVRQVVVDTDRGGEVVQQELFRHFGAAVVPVNDRRDVVTVRFSGQDRGEDLLLTDPVRAGGILLDVPQLMLPKAVSRESALCALWQAGRLDLGQLQVGGTGQENKFT